MAGQDEFFDEKIIDMMNGSEQKATNSEINHSEEVEEKRSIYNGIKIMGKWIYFERRSLAEETISMMLPGNFVQMDVDIAKKKYPYEQRPETILTDETGTINLMFQYMEGEVDDAAIEDFRNLIFGMMKRVNQGIKAREIGVIEVSGKKIAYAEFSNPTIDGKLYNLMFYLAVRGKPLMGSFNCQTKEMKYWRPVAFEMIQSIEIVESEE